MLQAELAPTLLTAAGPSYKTEHSMLQAPLAPTLLTAAGPVWPQCGQAKTTWLPRRGSSTTSSLFTTNGGA